MLWSHPMSLGGFLDQLELLVWIFCLKRWKLEPGHFSDVIKLKVNRLGLSPFQPDSNSTAGVKSDLKDSLKMRKRPAHQACLCHVLSKLVRCSANIPVIHRYAFVIVIVIDIVVVISTQSSKHTWHLHISTLYFWPICNLYATFPHLLGRCKRYGEQHART